MTYTVKRPSETRIKNGRRPAATPTRPTRRKPNPGLGPVMGSFFGLTKGTPTKGAAARAAKRETRKAAAAKAAKK